MYTTLSGAPTLPGFDDKEFEECSDERLFVYPYSIASMLHLKIHMTLHVEFVSIVSRTGLDTTLYPLYPNLSNFQV